MKYIIVLITLLFLGCKTTQEPINFILLDKHSGKTTSTYEVIDEKVKNTYIYIENYLIENLRERQLEKRIDPKIYEILFDYFKKNNQICLLEKDISSYSMKFYRKTKCTEYFINHFEDETGMFQTTFDGCKGDGEYSFYYERDENNSNMWTNTVVAKYWDKKYKDTIYCEPNHKKIKLPDMPIR